MVTLLYEFLQTSVKCNERQSGLSIPNPKCSKILNFLTTDMTPQVKTDTFAFWWLSVHKLHFMHKMIKYVPNYRQAKQIRSIWNKCILCLDLGSKPKMYMQIFQKLKKLWSRWLRDTQAVYQKLAFLEEEISFARCRQYSKPLLFSLCMFLTVLLVGWIRWC